MFAPTILKLSEEKKIINVPKKMTQSFVIICNKKMFYDRNILHMWQGQFILILLYEHIGGLLFYVRD